MKTCNGPWDWQTETERNEVKFFVVLWKYAMEIEIETQYWPQQSEPTMEN